MTPYQFSLLRYRHDVAAGEFINIGVVLWDPMDKKLLYKLSHHYSRLSRLFGDFDGRRYTAQLSRVSQRLKEVASAINGESSARSFDVLPGGLEGLHRLLLAGDCDCFVWSNVMAGIADDHADRLQQLAAEFVRRHERAAAPVARTESRILQTVEQCLERRGLFKTIVTKPSAAIQAPHCAYKFHLQWNNVVRQFLEPISFDYGSPDHVEGKALRWNGRLHSLAKSPTDFKLTAVVGPPTRPGLDDIYRRALGILEESPNIRRIIPETSFESFIPEIESDSKHRA